MIMDTHLIRNVIASNLSRADQDDLIYIIMEFIMSRSDQEVDQEVDQEADQEADQESDQESDQEADQESDQYIHVPTGGIFHKAVSWMGTILSGKKITQTFLCSSCNKVVVREQHAACEECKQLDGMYKLADNITKESCKINRINIQLHAM